MSQTPIQERHPIEDTIHRMLVRRWVEASIAVAILVTGIIMQAATSSKMALCNSVVGQIGQAFDQQANTDCSAVSAVHSFGSWLIWLGVAACLGGAYRVWRVYHDIPEARAHFAQEQPTAEKTDAGA